MQANQSFMPFAAMMLKSDDHKVDLGPLDIADAQGDEHAKRLSETQASQFLIKSGFDSVDVQITRGLRFLPMIRVMR